MFNRQKLFLLLVPLLFIGVGTIFFTFTKGDLFLLGHIRDYNEQTDYNGLVSILRENHYFVSQRVDFYPEKLLKWRAPYDDPNRKYEADIKVADLEGDAVGTVLYYMEKPKEGLIWILAVDKKARGLKLGERLLKKGISELKKKGAKIITIAVRDINEPAINLYRKVGFKDYKKLPGGYLKLRMDF